MTSHDRLLQCPYRAVTKVSSEYPITVNKFIPAGRGTFHNYVKMLAVRIRQGFRNVIPRFQLFTVRDFTFYLTEMRNLKLVSLFHQSQQY
jgi:hypothetical protein